MASSEASVAWYVGSERRRVAWLCGLAVVGSLVFAALVWVLQLASAAVLLTLVVLAGIAWRPRVGLLVVFLMTTLFEAGNLFRAALITGVLSTEAAKGSDAPFDARVHALRPHPGQSECAAALQALMAGSAIRASHLTGDDRVQDPYCLRCQPQVMGAALDVLRQAAGMLAIEANGVSDNPLIIAGEGIALSGGLFAGSAGVNVALRI